jgi:hypothetical protein
MSRRPYIAPTTQDNTPAPAIGHNQPPKPLTPDEVRAWLDESCRDLATRRAEILAGIDRFLAKYPTIPDDDIQGRATDFAGQRGSIAGWLKKTEERRETEKAPFLEAGRTVDAHFKTLVASVAEGRKTIIGRMNAYAEKKLAEERARAEREAAEAAERARIAEEAALKTMAQDQLEAAVEAAQDAEHAQRRAIAPAAELTRVYGAIGTPGVVSSLRSTWRFDEANSNLMELAKAVVDGRAPVAYLAFNTSRIGYAIRSERVRVIPGCTIREERSV